jgi:phosphatidylserine/phosphatidylglycerophosphate/cardiolipin synthase-like enzyme
MKILTFLGLWPVFAFANLQTPYNDGSSLRVDSNEVHSVQLIDSNRLALKERFDQIQRAQNSITVETYYFFPDEGGNILLKALLEKKRVSPAVRIQLLFDSWASTGLSKADVDFLNQNGIEVRWFVGAPAFPWGPKRHNHRKSWVFDEKTALIGGFNHASEHMGFSSLYNMVDREVLIEGPIVSSIQNSFRQIWNSAQLINPEVLSQESHIHEIESLDLDAYQRSVEKTTLRFAPLFIHRLSYLAETEKKLDLFPYLKSQVDEFFFSAKNRIAIESRYFIPTASTFLTLFNKIRQGVSVQILTNGDRAVLAYESHFLNIAKYALAPIRWIGAKVQYLSGDNRDREQAVTDDSQNSLWGTHSKTYVSDSKTLIGSYNLDPASDYLNLEHFVIFDSQELADQATQSISDRTFSTSLQHND